MNNQTPISWFKEYPAQMASSPKVIMLNASARGIYVFMRYHCWLNIRNGGGIPNDDGYIQRISNCTAEEWQASKAQILKNFEERNGELFDAELCQQGTNVFHVSEVRRESGRAGGRAKSKSAHDSNKTDDDEDETDETDKTDKTDKIRLDTLLGICSGNDEQVPSICQPSTTAPPSSPLEQRGVSAPPASPTSGRIAAPTSGVPLPDSSNRPQEKSKAAGKDNPDVQRIQAACIAEGGKLPMTADVERLLAHFSADEIVDALEVMGDSEDDEFLEYKFFVGGGAEILIPARRKERAREERLHGDIEKIRQRRAQETEPHVRHEADDGFLKSAVEAARPVETPEE